LTISLLLFARVRVANELGAANGQGAKFATIVSTTTSFLISLFVSLLALIFHDKLAIIFSSSQAVIDAVDDISVLLALTILLNGIQPVLSGTFPRTQHMVAWLQDGELETNYFFTVFDFLLLVSFRGNHNFLECYVSRSSYWIRVARTGCLR
jgi:Na+-driven multidrug efflux pump